MSELLTKTASSPSYWRRISKKINWGALKGRVVPMETRDEVVEIVDYWKKRAGTPNKTLFAWIGLHPERYREWKQ